MASQDTSPETTIAIILGASEFPKSHNLTPHRSFFNSAGRLKSYLLNTDGLGLPEDNLLNLFDFENGPSELDEKIARFLKDRNKKLGSKELKPKDILVYYVGHGIFSKDGDEYLLAIRSTRDDNEFVSSYQMKSLSRTLKEHARHSRIYLILDSCFSAAAFEAFQAPPLEVARRKTLEEFPKKGTALLCAANKDDPAKALPGRKYTLFSEALLDVLQEGSIEEEKNLSLATIGELTYDLIKERFPDDAVRPEIHSPNQKEGDVAIIPIFPNLAVKHENMAKKVENLESIITEITKRQSIHDEEHAKLDELLKSFNSRVDEHERIIQTKDFEPLNGNIKSEDGEIRGYHYGLTNKEWGNIPTAVKDWIREFYFVQRSGMILLIVSGIIGLISFFGLLFQKTIPYSLRTIWQISSIFCILLAFFLIITWIANRKKIAKRFYHFEDIKSEDSSWTKYDLILRTRVYKIIECYGIIRIGLFYYLLSMFIYIVMSMVFFIVKLRLYQFFEFGNF